MAAEITPGMRRLLEDQNFANLATLMPDGSPQVTPVWVDYDGTYLLINTAKGRVKDKNVRRDGRVAVSVFNQSDPYQMMIVRGRAVDVTEQRADEHINKMAKKYLGLDQYPYSQPGEQRVLIKIEPLRVLGPREG